VKPGFSIKTQKIEDTIPKDPEETIALSIKRKNIIIGPTYNRQRISRLDAD